MTHLPRRPALQTLAATVLGALTIPLSPSWTSHYRYIDIYAK